MLLTLVLVTGSWLMVGGHGAGASRHRTADGQGTLLVVGDSLTVGTAAFGSLRTRLEDLDVWSRVTIDARNGRKASTGAGVISTYLTPRWDVTAIVVAMGTNDMISNRNPSYPRKLIDAVMARTGDRPVLWVNLEFSSTVRPDWAIRATRFNRELRRAAERWPTLRIADWNSYFRSGSRVRFVADGVHLTTSAYRARARWLTERVRDFGREIVDSTTTTTSSTTTTSTTTTTTIASTSTSTSSTTTTTVG